MIYGYARVSTIGQMRDGNSLEDQEAKLRENGAEQVFVDAFTGTKTDRPEFRKLMSIVQPGDIIVATKLDRVSRSASQGIALVDDLLARGVTLHILNMGIMNNTPTGKLIRNIMFSFAEFERDMIVMRTQEGKAVARSKPGYKEGRPAKTWTVDFDLVLSKQRAGMITVSEACELLDISRSTWYKKMKELEGRQ